MTVLSARIIRHLPDEIVVQTNLRDEVRNLYFKANKPLWAADFHSLDFLAVSLCHYASGLGVDLFIDGPLSSEQLGRLNDFLTIWSVWRPDRFRRINIYGTSEIKAPSPTTERTVLAFSGGVDASFSLLAHRSKMLGRSSQDIDLGVLMLGWDIRLGDHAAGTKALRLVERALASCGAECATIETNIQEEFCHERPTSHLVPVAGMLQSLHITHGAGVVSSDVSYCQEFEVGPYTNTVGTNHLLGSPSFPIITTGGTHTRFERTKALLQHPVLRNTIRICNSEGAGGGNCGRCPKCIVTQVAIMALGHDPSNLFPNAMTENDIETVHLSIHALIFLEEATNALASDHHLLPILRSVIARGRRTFAAGNDHSEAVDSAAMIADLQSQITDLKQHKTDLLHSRSWRVTAPLRTIRRGLDFLHTTSRAV